MSNIDKRGQSLRKTQADKQRVRLEKLKDILSKMKGFKFNNVSALTEHVTEVFQSKYNEIINPSTLRRNGVYRRELDRFLGKEKEPLNELAIAQNDVILAESEVFKLKNELSAMTNLYSEQLSINTQLQNKSLTLRTDGKKVDERDTSSYETILKLAKLVDLEITKQGIIDDATMDGKKKVIVTESECPQFFEWYFEHK